MNELEDEDIDDDDENEISPANAAARKEFAINFFFKASRGLSNRPSEGLEHRKEFIREPEVKELFIEKFEEDTECNIGELERASLVGIE